MMRRNTRQRGGASAVPEVKNPTNKKNSSSSTTTTTTTTNNNSNKNKNKKRKGAPTSLVVDPPVKLIVSGDSVQQQVVEQVDDDDDDHDVCVICEDVGTLLICDGCEKSYHPNCLDPPLEMEKLSDGDWFCFQCNNEKKPAAAAAVIVPTTTTTNLSKRGARLYTAAATTTTATVAPKPNISWMDAYQKLIEYKNKHNGCTDVPHDYYEDPQLGRWVAYKRRDKKKLLKSHPERFEMLNSIGFKWKISPSEGSEIRDVRTSWMDMYNRLIDYKKQNNDTNVLRSYIKDPKLGRWVSDQRCEYRNDNLQEDRQSMLNKIGFEWTLIKTTTTNERSKSSKRPPPPQPEVVLADLTEQTAEVLAAVQAAIQVDQLPAQIVRAPPSTTIIDEPHEYDILFGRGGRVNLHLGNTWYRNVVKCSRNQYINSPKLTKKAISEAIVEATLRNVVMGRFLKQHKNSNNQDCWIEVPFRQAVNKTSQALRERYMLDGKKAKNNNNSNKDTTDANNNENGSLPLQVLPPTSLQQHQHQQPAIPPLLQACISLPMQVPIQADHHPPQLQPLLHPPPPPPPQQQQQLIQEGWYLQELLEESGCNVEMV